MERQNPEQFSLGGNWQAPQPHLSHGNVVDSTLKPLRENSSAMISPKFEKGKSIALNVRQQ